MKIVIPDAWTKPHNYYMYAGLRQERKKALGKPKKKRRTKRRTLGGRNGGANEHTTQIVPVIKQDFQYTCHVKSGSF